MKSQNIYPNNQTEKVASVKILDNLRELFKPILAALSTDRSKTLAAIDRHVFPLATETEPANNNNEIEETEGQHLEKLFCIQLNNKSIERKKNSYDEEIYY